MATSTTDLFRQALDLNEKDRATLAGLLIESLEEEPDEGVEEAWKEEIRRRVAEIESGEVELIPWEVVKATQPPGGHG
jgi:putative addiction module component (TIGR02574 family)